MTKIRPYSNSGVDSSSGFEFQKHSALYIFLEKYDDIKDLQYFICLEHHDDFLFCFIDDKEIIKYIETYQAKKASKPWSMSTKEFEEILQKILQVGTDLRDDSIKKATDYFHKLYFLSNHEIKLSKASKVNIINERNSKVEYCNLHQEIQDAILQLTNKTNVTEVNNLVFSYIDLAKTFKKQEQELIGIFGDVFGKSVLDHKASVQALLSLFRDVENTLNQGNIVNLLDKTKRVESKKINETIEIITTQQKAYSCWREEKNNISKIFKLSPLEHREFEMAFVSSFDFFKDLTQVEHQKIFKFVEEQKIENCYTDIEYIEKIVEIFNKKQNTQFESIAIKATIFAAYIELKERGK